MLLRSKSADAKTVAQSALTVLLPGKISDTAHHVKLLQSDVAGLPSYSAAMLRKLCEDPKVSATTLANRKEWIVDAGAVPKLARMLSKRGEETEAARALAVIVVGVDEIRRLALKATAYICSAGVTVSVCKEHAARRMRAKQKRLCMLVVMDEGQSCTGSNHAPRRRPEKASNAPPTARRGSWSRPRAASEHPPLNLARTFEERRSTRGQELHERRGPRRTNGHTSCHWSLHIPGWSDRPCFRMAVKHKGSRSRSRQSCYLLARTFP